MTVQIAMHRSNRSEFTEFEAARGFLNRSLKPSKWEIVMGDNGKYWVVSARVASVLAANGLEIVEF